MAASPMALQERLTFRSDQLRLLLELRPPHQGEVKLGSIELAKLKEGAGTQLMRALGQMDQLLKYDLQSMSQVVEGKAENTLEQVAEPLDRIFSMMASGLARDGTNSPTRSESYRPFGDQVADVLNRLVWDLRHLELCPALSRLEHDIRRMVEVFGSMSSIHEFYSKHDAAMAAGEGLLNLLKDERSSLAKESTEHEVEEDLNNQITKFEKSAKNWAKAFIVSVIVTLSLMLWVYSEGMKLWFIFPPFKTVTDHASSSYVIAFGLGKMIIVAAGISMAALCVRLYQTNIHNAVTTRHRLTSLRAFKKLLAIFSDDNDQGGVNRQNLVVHTCQAILQPSETGFLSGDLSKAIPLVQMAADLAKASKS